MTTYELITAFLSIAAPITAAIAWMKISLDKKFDKIDARFDRMDEKFDKIDEKFIVLEGKFESRFDRLEDKIDSIQIDLKKLNIRVAHIEGAYFGKELPKHVVIGED